MMNLPPQKPQSRAPRPDAARHRTKLQIKHFASIASRLGFALAVVSVPTLLLCREACLSCHPWPPGSSILVSPLPGRRTRKTLNITPHLHLRNVVVVVLLTVRISAMPL
ncbi:hypothetical protein K402DRAFT_392696, partial [Aulographum hederae CBS 113979]